MNVNVTSDGKDQIVNKLKKTYMIVHPIRAKMAAFVRTELCSAELSPAERMNANVELDGKEKIVNNI